MRHGNCSSEPSTEDPTIQVLRLLEQRPLSAPYLAKKVADAPKALRSLLKKALHRDRRRAGGSRPAAQFGGSPAECSHPGHGPKASSRRRNANC